MRSPQIFPQYLFRLEIYDNRQRDAIKWFGDFFFSGFITYYENNTFTGLGEKKQNYKRNLLSSQILSCQLHITYFSKTSQCIEKYMCILYIMRTYYMQCSVLWFSLQILCERFFYSLTYRETSLS